jgi:phage repressor protein C with HTH and peptisase S24 domain
MAKQFYEINADLVERIKSVMNEANERANAFAARLNYNPSNLSGILNGKRPVPASLIDAICKTYIVDKEWLLTGEEKQTQQPEVPSGVPYYNVDFTLGFDIMENDQTTIPDSYIDFPQYNRCTCWVNAHGDSMAPTISSGDMVALKKLEDFRYLISGEIYAIVTKNGLRTIKRVNDKGKNIQLIPDNKDYQEQFIPKEELLHVFVVKGCMKAY